ncbi:MAG: CAP domain-containing protein, partial [Acidimicrobiia bacterium]|nr:CAP domain-containing protein [Acidimicrobiia bacterium]
PTPTPTTQPPAPPAPTPPAPTTTPAPAIDPDQAASQFFDLTNGERANAGVPALEWRADVAAMAVSHSADMAQQANIFHGSFVSVPNLAALNASALGENVGMGGDVVSIHVAFMNSPHHRENILDGTYNQVGIGVIVSDGLVYVTEDFLHSRSAGTARPTPVAHPTISRPVAPRSSLLRVAAAPPRQVAAAAASGPAPLPATTAAPQGVITPVPLDVVPAAVAVPAFPAGVVSDAMDGGVAVWGAMFGALLLFGVAGGHVVVRRRRSA